MEGEPKMQSAESNGEKILMEQIIPDMKAAVEKHISLLEEYGVTADQVNIDIDRIMPFYLEESPEIKSASNREEVPHSLKDFFEGSLWEALHDNDVKEPGKFIDAIQKDLGMK